MLHNGKGGSRRDTLARDSTLTWLPVGGGAEEEWGWALERIEAQLGPGERAWGVKSTGLGTHGLQVAGQLHAHPKKGLFQLAYTNWLNSCIGVAGGAVRARPPLQLAHGRLGPCR